MVSPCTTTSTDLLPDVKPSYLEVLPFADSPSDTPVTWTNPSPGFRPTTSMSLSSCGRNANTNSTNLVWSNELQCSYSIMTTASTGSTTTTTTAAAAMSTESGARQNATNLVSFVDSTTPREMPLNVIGEDHAVVNANSRLSTPLDQEERTCGVPNNLVPLPNPVDLSTPLPAPVVSFILFYDTF